jgi:hypothetical protein
VQSALERLGNGCKKQREAPVVKRGRVEVPVEVPLGVRPEPEEEPRAKGLKRVTNIFTMEEPEGSKGEESVEG